MKLPTIFVVINEGVRDIPMVEALAWFFDEGEAERWMEERKPTHQHWAVHEVAGPEEER